MSDWTTPTKFLQRFGDALELLCQGNRPSDKIMQDWLDNKEDVYYNLQNFCSEHGLYWMQGIQIADAALMLADNPTWAGA